MKIELGKTYQYRSGGKARIICVDANIPNKPVIGLVSLGLREYFAEFTASGRIDPSAENPMDLIWEYNPWLEIKIDAPVLGFYRGEPVKGHFAGFKNGEVLVWAYGRTSFTNIAGTIALSNPTLA